MLSNDEILDILHTAGAIRRGHFELSSGRHSDTYVQCALVLQYPRFAEKAWLRSRCSLLGRSHRCSR